MNLNYFNNYSLFIAISFLKCNDISYAYNLIGGEVIMGMIMFLGITYFFNLFKILKILMVLSIRT